MVMLFLYKKVHRSSGVNLVERKTFYLDKEVSNGPSLERATTAPQGEPSADPLTLWSVKRPTDVSVFQSGTANGP